MPATQETTTTITAPTFAELEREGLLAFIRRAVIASNLDAVENSAAFAFAEKDAVIMRGCSDVLTDAFGESPELLDAECLGSAVETLARAATALDFVASALRSAASTMQERSGTAYRF
jgi:hypothetical protein